MRLRRKKDAWTEVESSAVRCVCYNPAKMELDVRFEEGREYRYFQVPRSKYRALLTAESIGAFVNSQIKPYHRFEEISQAMGH
jgi:hypothetical protein